jgi:hypothetical protein
MLGMENLKHWICQLGPFEGKRATYSGFWESSGNCACSWPMLEKEELREPGRPDEASSGCSFSVGE